MASVVIVLPFVAGEEIDRPGLLEERPTGRSDRHRHRALQCLTTLPEELTAEGERDERGQIDSGIRPGRSWDGEPALGRGAGSRVEPSDDVERVGGGAVEGRDDEAAEESTPAAVED